MFVNSTFQITYFAYILPAYQLTFTLSSFLPLSINPSFSLNLSTSHFPLPLLASHLALPPKFISVPSPCCWSPAAQNITQGQRCLFHYLLASLFQGCTPSVLQHILHLKDFWLKKSELEAQKLLPRQNLLLELRGFSLVEFSPLPKDISRWLCSQISCEEKLTGCKQSYQAREKTSVLDFQ